VDYVRVYQVNPDEGRYSEDPSSWVIESFPWTGRDSDKSSYRQALLRLPSYDRNVAEHIETTETKKVTARRSSISTEPFVSISL